MTNTPENVTTVLLAAAERLRRDDWCQGTPSAGTARCLGRAVIDSTQDDGLIEAAFYKLRSIVGGCFITWNDAPNRSREDVISVLELAAGVA